MRTRRRPGPGSCRCRGRGADDRGRPPRAASAAPGPGVGVLGGARLSNEDAYAWAKLAKGVIGTDSVDAQLGDGLPAEVVLGLPRATIDEACAGACRGGPAPATSARSCPSCSSACGARPSTAACRWSSSPPRHGAHRARRPPSLRYRPGEATDAGGRALSASGTAPEGVDPEAACRPRAASCCAGDARVVVVHRPAVAGRGRRRWRPPRRTGCPSWPDGPLPPRPAARQRDGCARHGSRPGPAARPGQPRRGPGLGRRQAVAGDRAARPRPGSTRAAILGRSPTARSTRWCCSGPTPSATSPTAPWPSEALAGATFVVAVDGFLVVVGDRWPTWCCPRPIRPRARPAPPPTSKAGSPAWPEARVARSVLARLDDRRRARRPPGRRPRLSSVGRALGRDRAAGPVARRDHPAARRPRRPRRRRRPRARAATGRRPPRHPVDPMATRHRRRRSRGAPSGAAEPPAAGAPRRRRGPRSSRGSGTDARCRPSPRPPRVALPAAPVGARRRVRDGYAAPARVARGSTTTARCVEPCRSLAALAAPRARCEPTRTTSTASGSTAGGSGRSVALEPTARRRSTVVAAAWRASTSTSTSDDPAAARPAPAAHRRGRPVVDVRLETP